MGRGFGVEEPWCGTEEFRAFKPPKEPGIPKKGLIKNCLQTEATWDSIFVWRRGSG